MSNVRPTDPSCRISALALLVVVMPGGAGRGPGEACGAEIDRQHSGAGELPRDADRMAPGAAAGDQDVDVAAFAGTIERGVRMLALHQRGDRLVRAQRFERDPARIGILLVLLLNLPRDVVLDRSEARDCGAGIGLRMRLTNLLVDHRCDRSE